MGNPFAAAAASAERVLDNTFSERVMIVPKSGGEYTVTDDPVRLSFDCRAVVRMESGVGRARGAFRNDPAPSSRRGGRPRPGIVTRPKASRIDQSSRTIKSP